MKRTTIVLASTILLVFVTLQFNVSQGKNKTEKPNANPRINWSLVAMPYFAPQYKSLPVAVTSVTTEAPKGKEWSVTKVGVTSRSGNVESLRLRWYLTGDQAPGAVLLKEESTEVQFPHEQAAFQAAEIEYPLVKFSTVAGALVEKKLFHGALKVEVEVCAVKFTDGRIWKSNSKDALDYMAMPRPAEGDVRFEDASLKVGGAVEPLQTCYPNYTTCTYTWTGNGTTYCDDGTYDSNPNGEVRGGCENGGYYSCGLSNTSPVYCVSWLSGCTVHYCG
jgi:hypothetical protein